MPILTLFCLCLAVAALDTVYFKHLGISPVRRRYRPSVTFDPKEALTPFRVGPGSGDPTRLLAYRCPLTGASPGLAIVAKVLDVLPNPMPNVSISVLQYFFDRFILLLSVYFIFSDPALISFQTKVAKRKADLLAELGQPLKKLKGAVKSPQKAQEETEEEEQPLRIHWTRAPAVEPASADPLDLFRLALTRADQPKQGGPEPARKLRTKRATRAPRERLTTVVKPSELSQGSETPIMVQIPA